MTKSTPTPPIKFSDIFNKHLKAAPREIRSAFFDTIQLFIADRSNPYLRDHALKERRSCLRSIDVTDDWRALYKSEPGEVVIFVDLGTHDQLYG
jgi:mRNA-degrading endonuclease YafQ of YafQ-DinJ toxin-antitoxin module